MKPTNSSNTTKQGAVTPPLVQNTPQTPPPSNAFNDPWGTPPPSNNPPQKALTPQERVGMIEKVYEDVLNRKPETKDINYYKYSTLKEEEIRKQILTGKEHKQLLEDGKEHKALKGRAQQAETRVKMLEGQIRDQVEEFKQLTRMLKEKNRYIQDLRQKMNNPYGLKLTPPPKQPVYTPPQREVQPVAVNKSKTNKVLEKLATKFLP